MEKLHKIKISETGIITKPANITDLSNKSKIFFSKVPFTSFKKDFENLYGEQDPAFLSVVYDKIELPKRSTKYSAGYDISVPFSFSIKKGRSIVIPTGIRCKMDDKIVMLLFPRSGMGFKNRLGLANTIGVVDADYYNADNYGHIMVKLVYNGDKYTESLFLNSSTTSETTSKKNKKFKRILTIDANQAFAQAVFTPYFYDRKESIEDIDIRKGGFGSTDSKKGEIKND